MNQAPGRDLVQAYDLSDPAHPKLAGEIELTNSVIALPTVLAVTPDGMLGLVANAPRWKPSAAGALDRVMNNRLFVIDLKARPLKLLATVHVGRLCVGRGPRRRSASQVAERA